MLDTDLQQRWTEYLQAEQDRIRDVTMPALARFIEAFARLDESTRHDWALQLAADVADRGADTPVRHPLFEQVLLPALVAGIGKERPGCARWLAHFELLLFQSKNVALPDHLRSATGLLLEAIRLDPIDRGARQALVERRAFYLEYTLHELPAGVLHGHNGATVAECEELVRELADFREHVELLGELERFGGLIAECERHFTRYREYLVAGRPGGSYERFLAELPAIRVTGLAK